MTRLPGARVQRQVAPEAGEEPFTEGRNVRKPGIVASEAGVELRDAPGGTTKAVLPFNTSLFVDREGRGGWYFVTLQSGQYGYVDKAHVKTNLPEPSARLHRIKPGETALAIVKQYYKGSAISWGQDERFYVNALVFANQGPGLRGIYKPGGSEDWSTTQTRANYLIWVPSLEFAQSLKGQISSGSISYEAWSTVKSIAGKVAELVLGGAAFTAGLLHGALESIWDALTGLIDLAGMVWSVLKSLLTGELLSDVGALWDLVKSLDVKQLIDAGLKHFLGKWNDPDLLSRWHFRGWLVGYAIAEIALMFVSGGAVTALKWAGKSAKLGKLLASLPKLAKLAERASQAQKLLPPAVRSVLKGRLATRADEAAKAGKVASAGGELLLELPVKLGRLTHTLKLQRFAGKLQVVLCSGCHSVVEAIDAVLAGLSAKGPTKSLHTRLTSMRDKAARLRDAADAGKLSRADMLTQLNQLGFNLRDLLAKFDGDIENFSQKTLRFLEYLSLRKVDLPPAGSWPALKAEITGELVESMFFGRDVPVEEVGKFVSALQNGYAKGAKGATGVKVLQGKVTGGFTHELKIKGSANRLAGKVQGGVVVFTDFIAGGYH